MRASPAAASLILWRFSFSSALSEDLEIYHILKSLEKLDTADCWPHQDPLGSQLSEAVSRVQYREHPVLVISGGRLLWLPWGVQ